MTNVEHMITPLDADRDLVQIWAQNETLSLRVYVKSTTDGLTVKSFDVYLNDNVIATSSGSSECRVNYPLSGVPQGLATLKIVTVTDAPGYSESRHTSTKDMWINDVKPNITGQLVCTESAANGDIITAKFHYSCNVKGAAEPSVDFYWDNSLVGATATAPYEVTYKVADQTAGIHEAIGVVHWSINGFGTLHHTTNKVYVNVN